MEERRVGLVEEQEDPSVQWVIGSREDWKTVIEVEAGALKGP